jgi:hypothetical protein
MRAKKFAKRLNLNKKTIANLENNELDQIHGGEDTTIPDHRRSYELCSAPGTICCF